LGGCVVWATNGESSLGREKSSSARHGRGRGRGEKNRGRLFVIRRPLFHRTGVILPVCRGISVL
jgi:hypothetical protein